MNDTIARNPLWIDNLRVGWGWLRDGGRKGEEKRETEIKKRNRI
jgi:hypothetical protein